MFALIAACGGGDDGDPAAGDGSGVAVATVTRSAGETASDGATAAAHAETPPPSEAASETATAGPAAPVTSPTPAPPASEEVLSGFIYPIAGACLPQGDQLMPNAPRTYRLGIHEGVDFYNVDNCTSIGLGTPVMAVKAGRVIRIDHGYVDPTPAQMNAYLANPTTEASFDAFRGRQVWIDHGGGVVTRYCHLSGVAGELQEGDMVEQGQIIAYVGESGTPGSLSTPGTEVHLHWEVRVGDSYLGAGLSTSEVRALYQALFLQ
jgi:murein DD-endopeptidase MepM/ murein hydrolase activator NlpD